MYFKNIKKVELENLIKNSDEIYAHVKISKKETLKEHLDLCIKYFYKICEKKQLNNVFFNIENTIAKNLNEDAKLLYRKMFLNTIYMHDLGKINSNFQYKKMENLKFKIDSNYSSNNSNHSMLSAIIYINHFFIEIKQLKNKKEKEELLIFLLLNAYIISKHHSSLDSFSQFKRKILEEDEEGYRLYTDDLYLFENIYKEDLILNKKLKTKKLIKVIFEKFDKVFNENNKDKEFSTQIYIYERFLSSLLLSCDYYSTSEFMHGKEIDDFGEITNSDKFYKSFKNTDIYKSIRKYEVECYNEKNDFSNIKNINILRNELFLDAEKTMLENINKNIFYLEAPTGSGKSNVAFNLSFKITEQFKTINKIFYVYPFNTLVEQNIKTLEKTFQDENLIDNIAVINSVVPIKKKSKKDCIIKNIDEKEETDVLNEDYEQALLDRQFLHYPIVLTTHVSMFNYLFGTSKDDIFPLCQICNSIIVLDEIQSYKNRIWKEIIMFLNQYSKMLNIKIIIMSATLPNLDKLIDGEISTVKLIKSRKKYFENSIFKNRVEPDFSLLDIDLENVEQALFEHILESTKLNKNILIEFIKKETAMEFYKKLKNYSEVSDEFLNYDIQLMTGDDNRADRNKIINKIKQKEKKQITDAENIILVATQVIEAGVDIDMDIGYKDISMLDSEEQFLGRINRSCKKKNSKVYFFDLDSASKIYKKDIRKEKNINLTSHKIREILINKDFESFYEYVIKQLNKKAKEYNDSSFQTFLTEKVDALNFIEIEEKMKLIDELYKNSVFLNRKIQLEDGEILDGEIVWNSYIKLLKNNKLDYAQKKVQLSEVTANLNYFIYQVNNDDFTYEDRIGDIYYIEDGEKYFDEGKFNRKKFNNGIGDFI